MRGTGRRAVPRPSLGGNEDSPTTRADRHTGIPREVWWLVREDVRRTWISFPAVVLTSLLMGSYVGGLLFAPEFAEGVGDGLVGFLRDFLFLTLIPVLGVNFLFNRDYYYSLKEDNLSKRLAFLRALPIPAVSIVAGRAAIMLISLGFAVPSFFAAVYLLSGASVTGLGIGGYLAFAAAWVGYALFSGGFLLFVWLGLSWKTELKVLIALPVYNTLLAGLLNLALFEDGIVAESLELARTRGWLPATLILLTGAVAFVAWARAAARRLEKRELPG